MIDNNKVLAIIPARGGSKGIPRKNIVPLCGKPLIAWTIEAANNSSYIDRLILSSEDTVIIDIARQWGCEVPFVRPAELSIDTTPGIDPVLHALMALPDTYEYVVLLQPTSPLRNSFDIDGAIEKAVKGGHPACISVTCVSKGPQWMFSVDADERLVPFLESTQIVASRQELASLYMPNGAVYVANVDWLIKSRSFYSPETAAYVMPEERSVDIDSPFDLCYCEFIVVSS
ncbi:MAG: acylneuraminate cytidylyltransferase family protein [Sulfurimonas sp.]|nr:acylneuraminate cytidylyltransferase family protein [Sulfurimonas sp.]